MRRRPSSMVAGDGSGTVISMSMTQFFILIPALFAAILVLPGGYRLEFRALGMLTQDVRAGGTMNYCWGCVQYVPILMTLAFATSMGRVAMVAREVWKDDDGPAHVEDEL